MLLVRPRPGKKMPRPEQLQTLKNLYINCILSFTVNQKDEVIQDRLS